MPITKATASSIAPAAKGDLVVGSATNDAAVLGVGSNDQVLTADSSTATGLKWAVAGGGGMTLLSTTSLSGTTTNITGISGDYVHLFFQLIEVDTSVGAKIKINLNAGQLDSICAYSADQVDANTSGWGSKAADISNNLCAAGWIYNYAYSGAHGTSVIMHGGSANVGTSSAFLTVGLFGGTAPVTEINVTTDAGTATFTTGSIKVWGVK